MKPFLQSALRGLAILTVFSASGLRAGSPASEPSLATPPAAAASEEGLWVNAVSYLWLTAATGDMRIGDLSVPLDIGFKDALDALDELDMGFMGGLEAGRGRWSVGVDLTYMKASDDHAGGNVIFRSFRTEQTQWMINPFASYRLAEGDRWQIDGLLGARINIFELDLTGRFVKGGQVTVGDSREWADPVVGLRGKWALSDTWSLAARGDIGGFGVSSDLTWGAYAGLAWKVTAHSTLALGYRALATDYSTRSFGSDTVLHGPLVGLVLSF